MQHLLYYLQLLSQHTLIWQRNKFRCTQPCLFPLIHQQSLKQNKPILIISGSCKTDASVSAEPCTGLQQWATATENPVIPLSPGLCLNSRIDPAQWSTTAAPAQHNGTPEMLLQLKPPNSRKGHVKKLLMVWKSGIKTRGLILWAHPCERKKHPFGRQTEAVPGLCCFCKINTHFSIHEVTNHHLFFLIKPYFREYRTNFIVQLQEKTLPPSV